MNAKRTFKKRTFKKRVAVKKTVRNTKVFAKSIKKVLNRMAETKATAIDELEYPILANNNFMNASVNLSNTFDLAQGTGDGQRVGNSVNCTKAVLNLIVRKNLQISAATNSRPCVVSIFIGYLKNNRGESPDAYFGSLFEDGNSAIPWNGTMLRTLRVVNKKMFSVLHRYDFKVGASNPSTTANVINSYSNNDFNTFYKKKIPLKELLGKITWTEDGTAGSHNKDLWMFASYCNIDDSIDAIATDVANKQVDILYYVDTEYKDI